MFKKELIQAINEYRFVGIVCEDGHEHTVKVFGKICGTPFDDGDDLTSQLKYCEIIARGLDVEILTADFFEEAVEKGIIGGFF